MGERRVKLYYVSKEEIFRKCMRPLPTNIAVVQHKELPKGYEILEVQYDYRYGGFLFLVYHPSFPEVQDGAMIETVGLYDTLMVAYAVKPYSASAQSERK